MVTSRLKFCELSYSPTYIQYVIMLKYFLGLLLKNRKTIPTNPLRKKNRKKKCLFTLTYTNCTYRKLFHTRTFQIITSFDSQLGF